MWRFCLWRKQKKSFQSAAFNNLDLHIFIIYIYIYITYLLHLFYNLRDKKNKFEINFNLINYLFFKNPFLFLDMFLYN